MNALDSRRAATTRTLPANASPGDFTETEFLISSTGMQPAAHCTTVAGGG